MFAPRHGTMPGVLRTAGTGEPAAEGEYRSSSHSRIGITPASSAASAAGDTHERWLTVSRHDSHGAESVPRMPVASLA